MLSCVSILIYSTHFLTGSNLMIAKTSLRHETHNLVIEISKADIRDYNFWYCQNLKFMKMDAPEISMSK